MSNTIQIELTDSESSQLQAAAGRLGVPPQQLARTTIMDALNRLQNDEQFAEVVKTVLAKNSELYNRLAQ